MSRLDLTVPNRRQVDIVGGHDQKVINHLKGTRYASLSLYPLGPLRRSHKGGPFDHPSKESKRFRDPGGLRFLKRLTDQTDIKRRRDCDLAL